MVQQRTVEERLQMIEEYLLEIKLMLRPASLSQKQVSEQEALISVKEMSCPIFAWANYISSGKPKF